MAGQEDWELITINGLSFWGHRPCGQIIMQDSSTLHSGLCPAPEPESDEPVDEPAPDTETEEPTNG
jgi:hypothetical protein